MAMIVVDTYKCTGCARCEMACSFAKTLAYSHTASVIKVARNEEKGLDFPVTCIQCYRCVAACPVDALSIDEKGLVKLDREKCHPRTWAKINNSDAGTAHCGICAEACPLGILDFDDYPSFCTNCGRCVNACNQNALKFVDKPELPELPSIAEVETLTPSMRRHKWAEKYGEKLIWLGE